MDYVEFSIEFYDENAVEAELAQFCVLEGFLGSSEAENSKHELMSVPEEFDVIEFGSKSALAYEQWLQKNNSVSRFHKIFCQKNSELFVYLLKENLLFRIEEQNKLNDADTYLANYQKSVQGVWIVPDEFWVGPEWHAKEINCPYKIVINPGLAFGTGDHPTTFMCLRAMYDLRDIWSPESLLDFGAGSGVLSLAAKKLWPQLKTIVLMDNDLECQKECEKMYQLNTEASTWRDLQGFWGQGAQLAKLKSFKFDLIVSNIYVEVLDQFKDDLLSRMSSRAKWILSGLYEGLAQEQFEKCLIMNSKLVLERKDQKIDQKDNDKLSWIMMQCRLGE